MINSGVLKSVPIREIELDRTNPRIRKFLEMYGDAPTPEQIFLALGAGNTSAMFTSSALQRLRTTNPIRPPCRGGAIGRNQATR